MVNEKIKLTLSEFLEATSEATNMFAERVEDPLAIMFMIPIGAEFSEAIFGDVEEVEITAKEFSDCTAMATMKLITDENAKEIRTALMLASMMVARDVSAILFDEKYQETKRMKEVAQILREERNNGN